MARRRAVDTRVPDFDSGIHLHTAYLFQQAIAGGNIALPFTSYDSYPPLVHLLGALTIFITDMHPMALIMSSNIGFVPLMAFGCYGVGKTFASERAGLLAGLFAKADRGCSTLAAVVRRLFRDSAICTASGLSSQGVAFLLFPSLTHTLDPRACGVVDIVGFLRCSTPLTVTLHRGRVHSCRQVLTASYGR